MTDREICEQIVKDGDCTSALSCKNCPLHGGEWNCGTTREKSVEAARRWLEDHPEKPTSSFADVDLRDYFAAHALTALDYFDAHELTVLSGQLSDENIVSVYDGMFIHKATERAYEIADAMLKARVGNRIKEEEAK